jgi:hypothetical protein
MAVLRSVFDLPYPQSADNETFHGFCSAHMGAASASSILLLGTSPLEMKDGSV